MRRIAMIDFALSGELNLDSPVGNNRTIGEAFAAIWNWDTGNIQERMESEGIMSLSEIKDAINECRKFFMCVVVARAANMGGVEMMSRKVDEVWHNAILFTREYFLLSQQIFGEGEYIHHAPNLKSTPRTQQKPIFPPLYSSMFGTIHPIWGLQDKSDLWEDAVEGICITDHLLNCKEVCKSDAPCSCNDGGALCKSKIVIEMTN